MASLTQRERQYRVGLDREPSLQPIFSHNSTLDLTNRLISLPLILFSIPVREEWWSFFFTMAGKFRDMYEVVDPHTENFIDSYMYLGAPRLGGYTAYTPLLTRMSCILLMLMFTHEHSVIALPSPEGYSTKLYYETLEFVWPFS